jgi:hypothetical protein
MSDDAWIWGLRAAGVFHFITVALAHFTPIPADWDESVARLPEVHRRFAIAQNVFIGATMLVIGAISLFLARELISGSILARTICAAAALWWSARLAVLPWLRVRAELTTPLLRAGFVLLHLECASFAVAYGWLAVRPA